MADSLRDPRAFKVHNDEISFPADDAVHAAILRGDRPSAETYKKETYRRGQTIPAGRLPLSAAGVFEPRGDVVAVEAKSASNAPTAAPVAPAVVDAPLTTPPPAAAVRGRA